MLVLGIESSCDETAAAVLEDGRRVLSNAIASQTPLHQLHGGVVPEIASRAHLEAIVPIAEQALGEAGARMEDIGAIAATRGPGLIGCLLVGVEFAKALAATRGIPLVADLCASFQAAAVDVLVERARRALRDHRLRRLAVVGGVACNRGLRAALGARLRGIHVALPDPEFCTDNAAMIAGAAWPLLQGGAVSGLRLAATPSLALDAVESWNGR